MDTHKPVSKTKKNKLEDIEPGMKVSFGYKGKTYKGFVKEINLVKNKVVVNLGKKETLVPPSKLTILNDCDIVKN